MEEASEQVIVTILDHMDYASIQSFRQVSDHERIVNDYFAVLAKRARDKLGIQMETPELVERLYHLNGYLAVKRRGPVSPFSVTPLL